MKSEGSFFQRKIKPLLQHKVFSLILLYLAMVIIFTVWAALKNGQWNSFLRITIFRNILNSLVISSFLTIGAGCMIGAYTYILSGGEYDWRDPTPYAEQSGMCTKGPLTIGDDCWIGTRVTILDGAQSVGDRALVAACALVNKPVAARTIVGGVPAKVLGNAECRMQNAE